MRHRPTEKGGGRDGMAHWIPGFRIVGIRFRGIFSDRHQTQLHNTHCLSDSDEYLHGDVENLGNVIYDELPIVVRPMLRKDMPSLGECNTLLQLRRSGLPELGSVVLRYPSLPHLAGVAGPETEHLASGALRFPAHHRLHARPMHCSMLVERNTSPPGPCATGSSSFM